MKHTRMWFVFIGIIMASLFVACGNATGTAATGGAGANTNTNNTGVTGQAVSSISSNTSTKISALAVSLKVTSVDMALSLPSIRNYSCGTNVTETYMATFHFPANNVGGQVQFNYTINNGRGNMPTSLSVRPGQTTAKYAFSWSGNLSADNIVPGLGGVMVTSPNAYTSELVAPLGPCKAAGTAPFQVTSIGLTAGPEVTAHRCGSSFTETYTATFHIAPAGPGGTIVFQYTTNNGRSGSSNVSLHVAAGQTTATYVFTWSGILFPDHVAPGVGIVMMSVPNQIISPSATPEGGCTTM